MPTTEEMLRQTLALLHATHQRLDEIEAAQRRLEATLRATDWVSAATLAQALDQRPRWPEHWRNRGIFTIKNGCVRQIGTAKKPHYEYHLGRCREQREWWATLPPEGRAAYLRGDGEVA